jgi:glyoxylase-like metal-dependent hydrolase (beta-lactamase superfamily II)
VSIETTFDEYQDVNGLKLLAHLTTKRSIQNDRNPAKKQGVDGETGDPRRRPPRHQLGHRRLSARQRQRGEVAKGIWFLAGQSHHSVLVEFGDHLMLIEAPQNEARALAVIAKARELRPDKPLTHVVNSHHHFDHSGGIRAAVSEGLAVITQKINAPFFESAAARPHTVAPDALAKNRKPLKLETVDEALEFKDASMTVNVYHIAGNPHGDALLMAYFPKERILVEADAYNPGSAVQPYAANLLENVERRRLRVDRIVPLHGAIVPFSELLKTRARNDRGAGSESSEAELQKLRLEIQKLTLDVARPGSSAAGRRAAPDADGDDRRDGPWFHVHGLAISDRAGEESPGQRATGRQGCDGTSGEGSQGHRNRSARVHEAAAREAAGALLRSRDGGRDHRVHSRRG